MENLEQARIRLKKIYYGMKSRCYHPSAINYKYYGGRGIVICDEWKNDFETFYQWAIHNGYEDSLTIDRIDNNKNYCPENCRWVCKEEQQKHKSSNKPITFNGKTLNQAEWERELNLPRGIICQRLAMGWSEEKALTTPPSPMYKEFIINGESHTLTEWIKIYHLEDQYNNICNRIYHCGWDIEKALFEPLKTETLFEEDGESHTFNEWAEIYQADKKDFNAIRRRIEHNWGIKRAFTEPIKHHKTKNK